LALLINSIQDVLLALDATGRHGMEKASACPTEPSRLLAPGKLLLPAVRDCLVTHDPLSNFRLLAAGHALPSTQCNQTALAREDPATLLTLSLGAWFMTHVAGGAFDKVPAT